MAQSQRQHDSNIELAKTHYYYTSNGEFRINLKTWMSYGLIFNALLIIASIDTLYRDKQWLSLIISSILFIIIVLIIRRLNNEQ